MKISYNSQPQRNLIGNQVLKLRGSRKLSQKKMVAQLQVQGYYFSKLTILRIEKGKRLMTDTELKILCDYFHITPNDLPGYGDDGRLVWQCIVRVFMHYIANSPTTTFQSNVFFTSGMQQYKRPCR